MNWNNVELMLIRKSPCTRKLLGYFLLVGLLLVMATPVMAQDDNVDEPSLLEQLHAVRNATTEATASESDVTESDVTESDVTESDVTESDVTETGVAGSDVVETDTSEVSVEESITAVNEVNSPAALPPVPIELPRMAPPLPKLAPSAAANTASPGQNATPQGAYSPGFITPAEEVKSFLRFPDDIEQRTTAFDPGGVELPEGFTMPDIGPGERWIRVDLGHQRLYAYEGEKPVRGFVVSSGLPGTATVTGEFRIITKVSDQVMSGGGSGPGTPGYYYLPHVKWVMYFYSEYALHGSYWHANFGNPMSHGCVNMTNADSKWLFDWTGPKWDGETVWYRSTEENPGTRVIVHQ